MAINDTDKSHVRNWNIDNLGGQLVIKPNRNLIVAGQQFDMCLDDVEHFIHE